MDLSRHTPGRCPGFRRDPAFGCRSGAAEQDLIARNFAATCFRLSLRRGRTGSHCPELRRNPASVHEFIAAHARTLPGFSPRLAFGCRSGAAEQDLIARNFTATLLSVVAPARQNRISLPETSPRPCFGSWICRGTRPDIARFFTAPCFRLSLRRGRIESHCPELRRVLTSVHGFVAAHARTLPGFSPRPAFGCRSGAARVKNIARNFSARCLWCMTRRGQSP